MTPVFYQLKNAAITVKIFVVVNVMEDRSYMDVAIEEAKKAFSAGDVPVGAVIVKDGVIIARAHNMREETGDATAHAEMLAVREACRVVGGWRLSGCTMYVTLEPCPMCAGALVMSRMDRLVYALSESKTGAAESVFNIVDNKALNHRLQVTSGIGETECRELLQRFFKAKRDIQL